MNYSWKFSNKLGLKVRFPLLLLVKYSDLYISSLLCLQTVSFLVFLINLVNVFVAGNYCLLNVSG